MPEPAENSLDSHWMQRALLLAERSVGVSSPNPAVGCVLVQDDSLIGEGFHAYELVEHAEVVALRQAGDRARGATAYVTLEPCSHQGRTAPCADALLAAGVRRAVVATGDPNPLVNGRGIEKLRAGGVEVTLGLFEAQARKLNDGFAKYIRTSLPFVLMKIAATLDGRIAPAKHASKSPFWISGEAARAEVQRMRHAADALLVGVDTVLADDPRLTDRSRLPRRRSLLRVVLDSSLRLPLDSQLVATADNDVLVFFTEASLETQQELQTRGVRLQQLKEKGLTGPSDVERPAGRVPLPQVAKFLAESRITSLLVEGGSRINAALLQEDLVDRMTVFYAQSFLGPDAAPMLASLPAPRQMKKVSLARFGEDFAFDAYLHDPWE